MRRGYLILIFIVIGSVAKSQIGNYTPFPEDTAMWEVKYYNIPGSYWDADFIRYTMQGDTIINSVSYNKIYRQIYQSKQTGQFSFIYNYGSTSYFAGLRQDTLNRKVYSLVNGNLTEDTLYDFNVNSVNDTIRNSFVVKQGNNYYPNYSVSVFSPAIVWQIDSINISQWNRYFRVYNFDASQAWGAWSCHHPGVEAQPFFSGSGSLIEGIGSCWGLFEKIESTYEYAGWSLNGFCSSRYGPCNTKPLVIQNSIHLNDFKIGPNPVIDRLNISGIDDSKDVVLKIFNSLGQCVFSKPLISSGNEIDLTELPQGIYLAQIYTFKGPIAKKIIKD